MNKEKVEWLKKQYLKGTSVELLKMDDKQAPPANTKGIIQYVDDIGTIHVQWENGSTLGLIYGEDKFIISNSLDQPNEEDNGIKKEWVNMGDVNFWSYGRLVRRHWPDKESEYDVLICDPVDNGEKMIVAYCYINISDSWIDRKSVMNYAGQYELDDEAAKMRYAIDCISYYGIHNFQPSFPEYVTMDNWMVSPKAAYEWLCGYNVREFVKKPSK